MRRALIPFIVATAFFASAASAQTFSNEEEDAIRELVADYLLEHPEIVMEAIQILRQRQEEATQAQAQAALTDNANALTHDPNSPVGGNPDGDITIVEFFDYRCGFCKRTHPTLKDFVKQDGNIRFVYKEWPILGPESTFAARAALAAREQGKYHEFHSKLMVERNVTETSVKAIAEQIGLDWAKLETDMDSEIVSAHIEDTVHLAQALGISGTPAFVIGNQLVPGAIDGATLEAIIKDEREDS